METLARPGDQGAAASNTAPPEGSGQPETAQQRAGEAAGAAAAASAPPGPGPAAAASSSMPPPPMRATWASAAAPGAPGAALPSSSGRLSSSPRAAALGVPSTSAAGARSVSPAAGSHFPQLARPLPGGAAVTGSTHDTMSPTAAPWAVGVGAPPPGPPGAAGGAPGVGGAAFPGGGGRGGVGGAAALRRPGAGAALTGKPVAALVDAAPGMPQPLAAGDALGAFEAPAKQITSEEDLRRFLEGPTAKDFVAFILSLNQAVTGGLRVAAAAGG
jgi:hypothetical protein